MNRRRRALSLIELTIVILIIGITAALAAPRLSDTVRAAKLLAAANQLAAHIDYIRSEAINRSQTTTLTCDNDGETYSSADVDFPERPGERIEVSIAQWHDESFDLTANFDSQSTLTFDLEGVPHVDGSPLVSGRILLRFGVEAFTIEIAPTTGQIEVERHTLTQFQVLNQAQVLGSKL